MSQFVVVLGMHRSGTSLLMQWLRQAGLYLGDNLMSSPAADNLEGHWENNDVVAINDALLATSGGSWLEPPAEVRPDESVVPRMRAFLTELSARPPAGCKDPRTVLTFPIWKPHLRDYRIAACFRHPLAVARSLEVRNRMPLEAGLALWRAYNERLLAVTANEPDVDWFCFDEPAGAQARRVRGVCARAGLNVDAIDASQFNPHLKHHRDADPIADPALADLYARLQDRLAARPTDASAAKPVSPRARAARRRRATERAVLLQNVQIQDLNYRIGGAEHRARLAEEGRQAVAAQAEAARQAQAAEIAALQAALGRAGQELAALHATVVRLEADLARVASRTEEAWIFAARLRNIWPLRLRRWLGSLLARRPAHEGRM